MKSLHICGFKVHSPLLSDSIVLNMVIRNKKGDNYLKLFINYYKYKRHIVSNEQPMIIYVWY